MAPRNGHFAPDPPGQPGTEGNAGQPDRSGVPLAWWRTRSWRKDLSVLIRLRRGLKELDTAGPPDDPEGAEQEPAPAPSGGVLADPDIAAIRASFAIVAEAGDDPAGYFYGRLFAAHPGLRDLFPPAMDEQRDRLFRALARIVESLSTPEELAEYLGQLGRDHRKYGVEPPMYEAVGEALIATIRAYAGAAFTPQAQDSWTQAYLAASSLMIRAAEEDAAVTPACWTAEVIGHETRYPGVAVLTVAPDVPLPYQAGQHVTVQTPRWPRVWRPYSIACRPREDGLVTFHVRAVPGGWVSSALVYHTEPGQELILGPALGTMTLAHAGQRDLLCVAGGTGLSPVKAIIEQAVRESSRIPRRIYLFYGARTRAELYDLPDLWRLADAYPGLQLTPVTSEDPAFAGMQGNVGRVAARYLPHRECEAYVAGPPDMVRETVRVLQRAGIPGERIHYDDALLADRRRPASPAVAACPVGPAEPRVVLLEPPVVPVEPPAEPPAEPAVTEADEEPRLPQIASLVAAPTSAPASPSASASLPARQEAAPK